MEIKEFVAEHPIPFLAKAKKTPKPNRPEPTLPGKHPVPAQMISIIIPAHNEEAYLGRTLEALRRQTYGWFEVIVVANGCTDRTAEIAKGMCQRLIVLSQKSLGVSRNLGARMAKGEILVFLDADTILEPTALGVIAQEFTKKDAAGTLKGQPDINRWSYKTVYFFKNLTHRTGFHRGSAGVIICWREHFIEAGGFDEGLEVRENSELICRLQQFGGYRYIDQVAATTSMRRYAQQGCLRVIWLWCKLWFHTQFGDLHRRTYETVR